MCIDILMTHRQEKIIRKTMAFAVPITVVAFLMGVWTMPIAIGMTTIDAYDIVALLVATAGCFLYNWTDEDEEDLSLKEREEETNPYYFHYHKQQ
jgi:hypothetical protein